MALVPSGCLSSHKQKQLGCFITPGTGSQFGRAPSGPCALSLIENGNGVVLCGCVGCMAGRSVRPNLNQADKRVSVCSGPATKLPNRLEVAWLAPGHSVALSRFLNAVECSDMQLNAETPWQPRHRAGEGWFYDTGERESWSRSRSWTRS